MTPLHQDSSPSGHPGRKLLPQWMEIVPEQGRPRFVRRSKPSTGDGGPRGERGDLEMTAEDAPGAEALPVPIPRDLPAALGDLLAGGASILAVRDEPGLRSAMDLSSRDRNLKAARPSAGLLFVEPGSSIPLETLAGISRSTGIPRWLVALEDRCLFLERRSRRKAGLLQRLAIRFLGKRRKGPFKNPRGLRYQTSLPHRDPAGWLVLEDGTPLLKECTRQRPLEEFGGGLYHLSEKHLDFTSSDGSDPNTNHRSYAIVGKGTSLGRWLASNPRFASPPLTECDACAWIRATTGQHGARAEFVPHSMIASASSPRDLADRIQAIIQKDNRKLAESPPHTTPTSFLFLAAHLRTGGAERQIVNLATGLKSLGHEVRFLTLRPVKDTGNPLLEELLAAGIPVQDIDHQSDEPDLAELFQELDMEKLRLIGDLPDTPGEMIWKTAKHLLCHPVDVVCSFLDEPNIVGTFASILVGQPQHAILSFRNVNPSKIPYYESWFLDFYHLLRESRRAVFTGNSLVGNEDYRAWMGLPPETVIHHLPNGVDFDGLRRRSMEEGSDVSLPESVKSGPVVLGVFRLVEQKRPMRFLQVAEKILQARSDVSFLIAGDGPDREAMEKWIADHELGEHIHLLGLRKDVPGLMSHSDLLLSTSQNEGTPNAVLEAQGLRLPVVALDAGDMRRCVLQGESGFVHEQEDREGLVASCLRLIGDADLRAKMGSAGREWVTGEYGLSRSHHRFLSLFDRREEDPSELSPFA